MVAIANCQLPLPPPKQAAAPLLVKEGGTRKLLGLDLMFRGVILSVKIIFSLMGWRLPDVAQPLTRVEIEKEKREGWEVVLGRGV